MNAGSKDCPRKQANKGSTKNINNLASLGHTVSPTSGDFQTEWDTQALGGSARGNQMDKLLGKLQKERMRSHSRTVYCGECHSR